MFRVIGLSGDRWSPSPSGSILPGDWSAHRSIRGPSKLISQLRRRSLTTNSRQIRGSLSRHVAYCSVWKASLGMASRSPDCRRRVNGGRCDAKQLSSRRYARDGSPWRKPASDTVCLPVSLPPGTARSRSGACLGFGPPASTCITRVGDPRRLGRGRVKSLRRRNLTSWFLRGGDAFGLSGCQFNLAKDIRLAL